MKSAVPYEKTILFNKNIDSAPEFVRSLLSYLNTYGGEDLADTGDRNYFRSVIGRIAEIRHTAMYGGFAYDDFVFDRVVNREVDAGIGLDWKVKEFKSFTDNLVSVLTDDVGELLPFLPQNGFPRSSLILSVNSPPFELTDLDDLVNTISANDITGILEWLQSSDDPQSSS